MFWQGSVSNIVDPTLLLLCAASFGRRKSLSVIRMVPGLQEVPTAPLFLVWLAPFIQGCKSELIPPKQLQAQQY